MGAWPPDSLGVPRLPDSQRVLLLPGKPRAARPRGRSVSGRSRRKRRRLEVHPQMLEEIRSHRARRTMLAQRFVASICNSGSCFPGERATSRPCPGRRATRAIRAVHRRGRVGAKCRLEKRATRGSGSDAAFGAPVGPSGRPGSPAGAGPIMSAKPERAQAYEETEAAAAVAGDALRRSS